MCRAILASIPEHRPNVRGWFQFPNHFMDDLKFAEGSTVKVYVVLLFHANREKQAWPSVARIAGMAGVSVSTAHRALRWLEQRHWIKGHRRKVHSTRYKVWMPPTRTVSPMT